MTTPRTVSSAVIDQVTTVDTSVLGVAPAMAMAALAQTLANSAAMAAMNAVFAQQQAFIAHQAATTAAVAMLLELIDD
ncbi:MAG: RebB family R body protein [Nannocystaceae bacterium]|nr:RebB family R body protein [Nannocystaceae bacterium]